MNKPIKIKNCFHIIKRYSYIYTYKNLIYVTNILYKSGYTIYNYVFWFLWIYKHIKWYKFEKWERKFARWFNNVGVVHIKYSSEEYQHIIKCQVYSNMSSKYIREVF